MNSSSPWTRGNEQLDGLEFAIDELTDVSASTYIELENKIDCNQRQHLEAIRDLEAVVQTKMKACPSGNAIFDEKIVDTEVQALVCKEVKSLLMPAMEAAFIPLVSNFEQRMSDFEKRVIGEGSDVIVSFDVSCSEVLAFVTILIVLLDLALRCV